MGLIKHDDKEFTDWYRVQYNRKDKTWEVVRKRFKEPPERVPGTDGYITRTSAFGALYKQLARDFRQWD